MTTVDMEKTGQQFVNGNGINIQSEANHVPSVQKRVTLCTCCEDCLRCIKNWLPVDFKNEVIQLAKLAGPVTLSNLMIFLINAVSTVFCGHLGSTELGGVALAISIINVNGLAIGTGLASACDTLVSQTYGSGNLRQTGIYLQRGILILLLACFPCWVALINTEPLLLALKQIPEVARLCQLYVNVFLPALPAVFMFQLQGRYLQNQGIIWPQVVTGVIGNILNAIFNGIFLYTLNLGVIGSAAANAISQVSLALILYIYILCQGLHKATWFGWSLDCLQEWGPFMRVAFPSMLMLCLEWWMFEIRGLLAGLISEVELEAQSIIQQLVTIVYMVPMGISATTSVRVGNALGAGNVVQAVSSGKVSIICSFLIASIIGIVILSTKDVIGYIITTEKEIVQRAAATIIIYGFFHPVDCIAAVAGGILRGIGKVKIGAICNLVGYYCVGIPLGVSLMFAAKMGIVGLWWGFCTSITLQATFFVLALWKLDWREASEEAKAITKVQVRGGEVKQINEMALTPQHESEVSTISMDALSKEESHSDLHVLRQSQETAEAPPLTVRQLVLRRGLTVLLMVLFLAAGIVASRIFVKLLK